MPGTEAKRGIIIKPPRPLSEVLPGVPPKLVVEDALRRGIFTAIPDFARAAWMLGSHYREQPQHKLIVSDGTGARPFAAFMDGFLRQQDPLQTTSWVEAPSSRGLKINGTSRTEPMSTAEIASVLQGHDNWPDKKDYRELAKGGVLLLTNTLITGGSVRRMREAVDLATEGYDIPYDVLTAHIRDVVPMEPGVAVQPGRQFQRELELQQIILPGGGMILSPVMTDPYDSAEHAALVASRGRDVALDGPKASGLLRDTYIRNGIVEGNRGALIPGGLNVITLVGEAAGSVFRTQENVTTDDLIRAAEDEVIKLLPRASGSPSSSQIVNAIYRLDDAA